MFNVSLSLFSLSLSHWLTQLTWLNLHLDFVLSPSMAHLYSPHYQLHNSYMSPPHTHPLSQDVHYFQNEPVDLSVSKRSSVHRLHHLWHRHLPRATPPSSYESFSPVSQSSRPGSGSGSITGSSSGSSQTRQLTPPLTHPISSVRIVVMPYRKCAVVILWYWMINIFPCDGV